MLLEDGPYSDLNEKQKVVTLLNWLGQTAYQLHNEFDYTGASKDRLADVLEKFNNYFKPQHNMIHAWYHIGTTFSDSTDIKTQSDFMYRLKDLTKQCEFTNSDEVVKFLFLIHNKHSEVKRELLKHVTKETILDQCLEYAHNIEGNIQSVELSKYVDKIQVSSTGSVTSNVDAVSKKKTRRCDVTPARQNTEDEKPKCDKCFLKHKPKDCPALV